MFSNWANLSGWKTTDDPTGVLNGRVLIAEGAVRTTAETPHSYELLIQQIGESASFDIKHYEIVANYAFQQDWKFMAGEFLLLSRSSYSGSTVVSFYAAGFNVLENTLIIYKYTAGEWFKLAMSKIPSSFLRRNILHTIKFRTYGTDQTNLELEIDDELVLTCADVGTLQYLSGYPGMAVSSGTIYIDSFYINRYTIDNKEPTSWTPSLLGSDLSVWLSTSGKTTVEVLGTNYISAWSDISGGLNNASAAASQRPTYHTSWKNNYEGGVWETRTGSSRTTSFYTGPQDYGGANAGLFVAKTLAASGPITISFWMYGTEDILQNLGGFVDSADSYERAFWFVSAATQFEIHAANTVSGKTNDLFYNTVTPTTLKDGWHHVVITYTGVQANLGSTVKLYIDSSEHIASSSNIRNPDGPTYYGEQKAGSHFLINSTSANSTGGSGIQKGFLADCTYWDRVLTALEVSSLYNSGNYVDPTTLSFASGNLDDWWKFEETEGSNRKRVSNVFFADLKSTSHLINTEWKTYMKEVPTQGSSPTGGTGGTYYLGTNYTPRFLLTSPTSGAGSFYFGNTATASLSTKRYLKPQDEANIILNATPITLAFWIRLNGAALSNPQRLFTGLTASDEEVFYMETDSDGAGTPELRVYAKSDSYTSTPGDIYCQLEYDDDVIDPATTAWYHIVITWDGNAHDLNTAVKVYVNSTLQSTSSTTIANPALAVNYPLGTIRKFYFAAADAAGNRELHDSSLYSICNFNRVLTSLEVTELYNSGSVLDPSTHSASSALVNFWRFIQTTGSGEKNRLLDENVSISNSVSASRNLLQINGKLKDTTDDETWNILNQSFTVQQIGPSGGGSESSLLTIADNVNLDMNSTGVSVFIVMNSTSMPDAGSLQIVAKKGNSYNLSVKENKVFYYNGIEYGETSNLKFGTSELALISVVTDKDTAATKHGGIFIDGGTALTLTGIGAGVDNSTAVSIGADVSASTSTMLIGGIGEILIYKGELLAGDRQKVEGYLADKWNLALPANHPYRNTTPKTGD